MDPETTKTSITIAQLGPWIISAIALIQVWLIALYRKMRKPSVTIYESGNIELGYSTFGPTVGLWGTMRAPHKDAFVKRVSLQIVRLRDSSTHEFSWRFFRSSAIAINKSDPIRLEIVSSFLLTQNEPLKYNIVFVDEGFISENSPKVGYIPAKWMEFRNQKIKELESEHDSAIISSLISNPLLNEAIFDEFFKTEEVVRAYTILDRAFYWEEGDYKLSINVECSQPDQTFRKDLTFSLSREDVESLRLNSIPTLRALCGLDAVWNFAYPEYKKNDSQQ